ncbi:MAG TPA: hypothetical protein PKK36_00550 [Kiritimatiellia bacterium]|nr:hypothetical protein [Kiritimatiellia bacterium]
MTSRKYFPAAASLLITLAVWMIFTWPLPRFAASGIPAAHHRSDTPAERIMFPGDHLQLLYHFWLAGDMLFGETPVFHNVYEFNTGDDSTRFEPGAYYAPFSVVWALLNLSFSRALAWNLTDLFSLWLTAFFTWKLASRYTPRWPLAALAALLGIALPYRWVSLLGGSPTGFAMAWIPMLWLGLDDAIRRERFRAGLLAGLVILFACWTDTHVFFFSVLSIPVWGAIALIQRGRPRTRADWKRLAAVLLPVAAGVLLSYVFTKWVALSLDESVTAGGRKISEVRLFSPVAAGLFSRRDMGLSSQVYLGFAAVLLAAGGFVAQVWQLRTARAGLRRTGITGLLLLCIAACAVLSLGPRGPFDGGIFLFVRKVIPPYEMIRQPAKIFALLPTLLAMAVVTGWSSVRRRGLKHLTAARALAAAGVIIVAEYAAFCDPAICILQGDQRAYAAVAEDASARGILPRALVLTLWPGDSHYTSVYQDYASLYRIRLINGYRPMVPRAYVENVFRVFESMNQGLISDDQLASLENMGIDYVLLHEDLYPEKVSPFPVGVTLDRLLSHPRLQLLRQDGPVWAFRILDAARPPVSDIPSETFAFPAWHWEAENLHRENCEIASDSGFSWLAFRTPGASVITRPLLVSAFDENRWIIRIRGQGALSVRTIARAEENAVALDVDSPDWSWIAVPFTRPSPFEELQIEIILAAGAVDVDQFYLAGRTPVLPEPGQNLEMPASAFFHAGFTDAASGSVVLRNDYDPSGSIFYGFNLPLEPGRYRLTLDLSAEDAAPGPLGKLSVIPVRGKKPAASVTVAQPGSTSVEFLVPDNHPLRFDFDYSRAADVTLRKLTLARLE